jgi:hypothetical protein
MPLYNPPATGGGGSASDATTNTKGVARILGGSADAPTVPWTSVTSKPTIPAVPGDIGAQAADSDLTAIAGLTATTDNFLQAKSSAWASRTPAQVAADLASPLSSSLQPIDSDLTAIAALDSSTAGALATDGSGWIRKTYAQLKTALSLTSSDVGLGNVTNTAQVAVSTVDAKGDLLVGTANDAIARVAVGTLGQVPIVDSSATAGMSWASVANGQMPRSGGYLSALSPVSTGAPTFGTMRGTPLHLAGACTADRIGLEVTTGAASSTVRLGIYAEDATTGLPGSLLLDAGTIDSTTTGFKELTISQALSPGRYWLAAVALVATPTVRVNSGGNALFPGVSQADLATAPVAASVSSISGALPSTFGATSSSATGHRVYLRCA